MDYFVDYSIILKLKIEEIFEEKKVEEKMGPFSIQEKEFQN